MVAAPTFLVIDCPRIVTVGVGDQTSSQDDNSSNDADINNSVLLSSMRDFSVPLVLHCCIHRVTVMAIPGVSCGCDWLLLRNVINY